MCEMFGLKFVMDGGVLLSGGLFPRSFQEGGKVGREDKTQSDLVGPPHLDRSCV